MKPEFGRQRSPAKSREQNHNKKYKKSLACEGLRKNIKSSKEGRSPATEITLPLARLSVTDKWRLCKAGNWNCQQKENMLRRRREEQRKGNSLQTRNPTHKQKQTTCQFRSLYFMGSSRFSGMPHRGLFMLWQNFDPPKKKKWLVKNT